MVTICLLHPDSVSSSGLVAFVGTMSSALLHLHWAPIEDGYRLYNQCITASMYYQTVKHHRYNHASNSNIPYVVEWGQDNT